MARISYEHPEWQGDHDDPLPDTIWYRVDQSNSYWIYVDHPSEYLGGIPVGVQRAYQKELSSEEARAMAQALLEAADELDALKAAQEADRQRVREAAQRCIDEHGRHDWPSVSFPLSDLKCRRCGTAVVNETSAAGSVVFERLSFGGR